MDSFGRASREHSLSSERIYGEQDRDSPPRDVLLADPSATVASLGVEELLGISDAVDTDRTDSELELLLEIDSSSVSFSSLNSDSESWIEFTEICAEGLFPG